MRPTSIQDILPWVEQPSRYLGSEVNRIKKHPESVKLKYLLAFPDLYEIGTSHFGIQILYHIINRNPEMLAERVFAPAPDMEAQCRARGIPLASLESGTPMAQFDIIGFSLLYEMNYTNVLGMLSLAGIPFLSKERREEDPLIIAGGPCTINPEPVAAFFDAMVIGDGEEAVEALGKAYIGWKEGGDGIKASLMKAWAKIEGVYIPGYYEPVYDRDGFQTLKKRATAPQAAPGTVRRAVIAELRPEDFPDRPIVAFGKPIHDRLRLEVTRGCSRGCRFCQAGMIYRPVRERSVSQLMELTERSLAATGYEDLSLLSLSTGDYSGLVCLMKSLMARCEPERIAVSFPSLRAGTMSPELMGLVKRVRKTGFTMAVEAGSQRLRDIINKNIRREDILSMVEDAFRLGWQVIKLYFMIGLPGETQKDLEEMVALVKQILMIRGPRGRKGKVNVSVNTFIPKAFTPFQWAGQISLAESQEKIEWLKNELRLPRVQFKWQRPENSFLEGLWARGDRRLSKLLLAAFEKGCRFDGWSDKFQFEKWKEALDETGLNAGFYVTRKRTLSEPLPWDHIDCRVRKRFLEDEWEKAFQGVSTADCRSHPCTLCGVCDHKTLKPVLSPVENQAPAPVRKQNELSKPFTKTVAVSYAKRGDARFFGHLELVNIFLRAIRRARIPVVYSQGFHPMPKISFDDPLPLGYESDREQFRMRVPGSLRPETVLQGLKRELPEGLEIIDCKIETRRAKGPVTRLETYLVTLPDGRFDHSMLEDFQSREKFIIQRRKGKHRVSEIDLKLAVRRLKLESYEKIKMEICVGAGGRVRPTQVLSEVFGLGEACIQGARIIKL